MLQFVYEQFELLKEARMRVELQ